MLIKDKMKLDHKLACIQRDGPENFEILTDFDYTLTKAFMPGETPSKADSSFRALNESVYIPEEARMINKQLYQRFRPVEKNSAIPETEKSNLMH